MTEQEFLAWAIVTPETHTRVSCICPDCGTTFDRWLQNHLVADPINRQMEEQTTDCSFCYDEWEEENEEESY